MSSWRTSIANVQGIVDWDANIVGMDGSGLTPFIDTANAMVTAICATQAAYDTNQLELIERWLSAHFYAQRDDNNRVKSEGAGDANQSFQYPTGDSLNGTVYGQQVLLLDYLGNFSTLQAQIKAGRAPKVGAIWLGQSRDPSKYVPPNKEQGQV